MVYHAIGTADDFSALIRKTIAEHHPNADRPWQIMMYLDGVDPSE